MVYFKCYFSGEASEFVSNIYALTNLRTGTYHTLNTLPFFRQDTT